MEKSDERVYKNTEENLFTIEASARVDDTLKGMRIKKTETNS